MSLFVAIHLKQAMQNVSCFNWLLLRSARRQIQLLGSTCPSPMPSYLAHVAFLVRTRFKDFLALFTFTFLVWVRLKEKKLKIPALTHLWVCCAFPMRPLFVDNAGRGLSSSYLPRWCTLDLSRFAHPELEYVALVIVVSADPKPSLPSILRSLLMFCVACPWNVLLPDSGTVSEDLSIWDIIWSPSELNV